ncbi:MAG: superoxide dismutase [Limnochordia bacterium]|jgi:Fe-Mn family superoxide dismutase|nr:superoxide dismutase [Limnochordia bacterium]MDI9463968.1 superoxide dismutase [Bacillota bacterium]NLO95791.1 superoxide dismutase [Bacillota bacterium]HAN94675.1 superoxide dismutase [Bacillota bacterium]HOB40745.1 superoxide dismutase [Limnochordia bacterium]
MFEQVKLGYDFAALEPHIDQLTMETHYGKHHAGYTNNLNKALEQLPQLQGKTIEEILKNLEAIEDAALRTAVRNNGGGYYNHNLYFQILSPQGGQPPQGKLAEQIDSDFGSFENLVQKLTATAASVFGSGWAWLSKDPSGKLVITSTPNQDNPLMTHGGQLTPILGIDVWEHAYYLKYRNMRADYLQAIFKVIDWSKVAEMYLEA